MQSLYEDYRGTLWVYTGRGLAYFHDGRFFATSARVTSEEVYSITGDSDGNLWLSGNNGLSHLNKGPLVEHFPWTVLDRHEQAKVVLSSDGGVWLAFWQGGGVMYFKDGHVRDNGKGIDAAVLSSQKSEGHYGLPGMCERAKLIGGKLAIWSEPGAGTEVELSVPATGAYSTAGKGARCEHNLAEKQ